MNYKLIVAHCKTRGIGINNALPWLMRSDLKKFAKLTKGSNNNAIIMGKNTWLSIPNRPLNNRDNIILSTTLNIDNIIENNNVKSFKNIESIKQFCESQKYDTVWIIGGVNVYKTFLEDNLLTELHVTYIDEEYECDTFFPEVRDKWYCKQQTIHPLETTHVEYDKLKNKIFDKIYIKQGKFHI